MKTADILKRLAAGNQRFASGDNIAIDHSSRLPHLRDQQTPWASVLTCADSRVAPELIFDVSVGELFVVRVAGNVADPTALASLEYAYTILGCTTVIVMAHQGCGAVTAAIEGASGSDALAGLVDRISSAIGGSPIAESVDDAAKTNAVRNAGIITAHMQGLADEGSPEIAAIPMFFSLTTGLVTQV